MKAVSLLVIGSLVATCFADDRAEKLMAKYLRGDYNVNIVAIVKETSEGNGTQRTKIQRSKDGKIRETVLAPLHLQGEYVDDGREYKQYLPDDGYMLISPSQALSHDIKLRSPLIEKNYTLKMDGSSRIIGRRCVTVVATSRFNEVPILRYHFDEATGYPMAMETVANDGSIVNSFEVTDIKFPAKLDDSTFVIEPVAGVKIVHYDETNCLSRLSDAEPKLGFKPIVPKDIPFGFEIQRISVSTDSRYRILCLKLTDGLQRATVYEWTYVQNEKITTGEASDNKIWKGLKITVVADLGSSLRQSFLQPFLVRANPQFPGIVTSIGI
ncbi:MAG: outer membrane lipoprotein carrier protein LolA [Armatimonadetes bacterium]|nr:outer membrane lipoprotein carrier protein LolA [Armatimonadota bacterium]MBS1727882.1 outer membrane lipoprotein carrier protein LolA [Armatimonadota bacterium]